MRGTIKLGALLLLMMPATAQAMTVDAFLAKAAALQAKGMAAMMSPDLTQVRDEIKTAATAYRTDLDVAQAAGRAPRACPPPKGQAKIDPKTLITSFQAIPPAKRTMSVKAAFYSFMDMKYPCH